MKWLIGCRLYRLEFSRSPADHVGSRRTRRRALIRCHAAMAIHRHYDGGDLAGLSVPLGSSSTLWGTTRGCGPIRSAQCGRWVP